MSPSEEILEALEPGMNDTQCYTGGVKNRRVMRLSLRYWNGSLLPATRSPASRSALKTFTSDLHRTVKRQYGGSRFNPIILVFLGPVITYCINMLLDWWFAGLDMRTKVQAAIEEERKQPEP